MGFDELASASHAAEIAVEWGASKGCCHDLEEMESMHAWLKFSQ